MKDYNNYLVRRTTWLPGYVTFPLSSAVIKMAVGLTVEAAFISPFNVLERRPPELFIMPIFLGAFRFDSIPSKQHIRPLVGLAS